MREPQHLPWTGELGPGSQVVGKASAGQVRDAATLCPLLMTIRHPDVLECSSYPCACRGQLYPGCQRPGQGDAPLSAVTWELGAYQTEGPHRLGFMVGAQAVSPHRAGVEMPLQARAALS